MGKVVVLPADLNLLIQKNFKEVHECVEDSFMLCMTSMKRDKKNVLEMKKEKIISLIFLTIAKTVCCPNIQLTPAGMRNPKLTHYRQCPLGRVSRFKVDSFD